MERMTIAYSLDQQAAQDPVLERAMLFAEYDWVELVATVPQAEAKEPTLVY